LGGYKKEKEASEFFPKIPNSIYQEWLPLYDVFRNFKQELEIDLNSLKRFFKSSKTPLLCQNYY